MRWRLGGSVAVLGALALLVHRPEPAAIGAAWALFAAGAWLVTGLPHRLAAALVLTGGVLLPLAAAVDPPHSSDDMYRYVWDGRVQNAGTDPYHYPPDAPELRGLRDDFLWPERANWCTDTGCTRINRPTVPTIYPPVAEAEFAAVVALSPGDARETPMQLAAAAFAGATAFFLWYALRKSNMDPRRTVLWAWCPLVAIEAGNNAHVDVVAVFLAAVGLHLAARGKVLAGVVLGLAVGTKLTPALVLPAALRRRPVAVVTGVLGAVSAVYLPHLLAVGGRVVGYLPGYLHEEGYADGSRFTLLAFLPAAVVPPLAVLILAGVALWVLRTADPDRPWRAAAVLVAATLLVAAPSYPWYALLLAMLVAYGAPAEWLVLALAGTFAQHANDLGLHISTGQRVGYPAALLVLATGAVVRRRRLGRLRTGPHSECTSPAPG